MARYEEYGTIDVERALRLMFETPPYFDYYPLISRKYKDFEFSDALTDAERMEEFASIYQQFKKFVGSKMATVMGMQENLHSLKAFLSDQLERSDVYPRSRVDMVYTSLKVDWLRSALNQVIAIIEQKEGN